MGVAISSPIFPPLVVPLVPLRAVTLNPDAWSLGPTARACAVMDGRCGPGTESPKLPADSDVQPNWNDWAVLVEKGQE